MKFEWQYFDDDKLKVTDIAYHRNGVCGNGFVVVTFDYKDSIYHNMMAVLFEEPGNCAVFDMDLFPNIKFAENSWRGDYFEDVLRKEIVKWNTEQTE